MNFYKYLGHLLTLMSQIQYFNFFSSKTAGLIENKYHVKRLWDWWMKVSACSLGHMTKMAAMSI